MMKIKDKWYQLNIRGKRTVVISDIHGEKELLVQLLDKVGFSADDLLIINGDIVDKGRDSFGTMALVFELMEQPNVHVIEGNCDRIFDELYEDWLYDYMNYRYTVVHEYLHHEGKTLDDYPSQQALADEILSKYHGYQEKMRSFATAIETEDYLFVHAGISDIHDYRETSREAALTMPEFYWQHHQSEKIVVVGHYPACNFVEDGLYHHQVKVSAERRIIAMDGGNQVKESGQLNALIIMPDGERIFESVDSLSDALVIQDFDPGPQQPHTYTYPHYDITVSEGDDYFTPAMIQDEFVMVKTEWINKTRDKLLDDYTDFFHQVSAGEVVKVVRRAVGYILIKKAGIVGWVPEEVLE